ncbi:MAG: hypothetical protein L3J44_06520, partial [Campylobacteraceae bacterium]|nr:hypothetical protein [Campylobacteraceae bacterium]
SQSIFSADVEKQMKIQNLKVAKLAAKAVSSKLPIKIDKYTQFTKIEAKGLRLIYTFEINTGAKSDEAVKHEDKSRMKKYVIKGICQSSIRFLNSKINISYLYISAKTKAKLFQFNVTKNDCKKDGKAI